MMEGIPAFNDRLAYPFQASLFRLLETLEMKWSFEPFNETRLRTRLGENAKMLLGLMYRNGYGEFRSCMSTFRGSEMRPRMGYVLYLLAHMERGDRGSGLGQVLVALEEFEALEGLARVFEWLNLGAPYLEERLVHEGLEAPYACELSAQFVSLLMDVFALAFVAQDVRFQHTLAGTGVTVLLEEGELKIEVHTEPSIPIAAPTPTHEPIRRVGSTVAWNVFAPALVVLTVLGGLVYLD